MKTKKKDAKKNPKWPGLPGRLREAFRRADYWKDGHPDVLGFTKQTGFLTGYAYKYLSGMTVPDRENLFRIAELLDTTPQWLLFGEDGENDDEPNPTKRKTARPMHPIAGGSAHDQSPHPHKYPEILPLIRHCNLVAWLRPIFSRPAPVFA